MEKRLLVILLAASAASVSGRHARNVDDNGAVVEEFNNESLLPRFAEPIPNVTVTVGRDALLACVVENLRGFKVAWVRVDTQTILSIHHNIITQNARVSLSFNDHRSWYLHIKNVQEVDRGWYMCQINTDPMRSRQGYLQVVVPPSIVDKETSTDMVVREAANVTLTCKAQGYPEPYVMWRREDGEDINYNGESEGCVLNLKVLKAVNAQEIDAVPGISFGDKAAYKTGWIERFGTVQVNLDFTHQFPNTKPGLLAEKLAFLSPIVTAKVIGLPRKPKDAAKLLEHNVITKVNVIDGEVLHITKVSRLHMGAYLCIASNGVPPSISKRVMLRVQFPPMLSIPNQLEGAYVGQDVSLECHTEAYPVSINYWTTERGDMIVSGDKYEAVSMDNGYNKYMMLKIRSVEKSDFGTYQCVAKNSLGETDGMIKLDEIPAPSTTTTEAPSTTETLHKKKGARNSKKWKHSENQILEEYDVEEWRDTDGEDYTLPSLGPPEGVTRDAAALSSTPWWLVWTSTILCARSHRGAFLLTSLFLLDATLIPDSR